MAKKNSRKLSDMAQAPLLSYSPTFTSKDPRLTDNYSHARLAKQTRKQQADLKRLETSDSLRKASDASVISNRRKR